MLLVTTTLLDAVPVAQSEELPRGVGIPPGTLVGPCGFWVQWH